MLPRVKELNRGVLRGTEKKIKNELQLSKKKEKQIHEQTSPQGI
jgi:hypothetical protein